MKEGWVFELNIRKIGPIIAVFGIWMAQTVIRHVIQVNLGGVALMMI